MKHNRRHGRAAVRRVAAVLAGALALAGTTAPAHAGPADRSGPAGARMYLVKLADPPVAAYQGGLKGLKRTAPSPGDRLRTRTNDVRAYLRHLDVRRDEVLDRIPGVTEVYAYGYAFNGFAAKLTARQAAELAAAPGVVSLTRDQVEHLPSTPVPPASAAPAGDAFRRGAPAPE
ncbi:protease inhibitor I9 family protein, partial [Streptomyces sp. NPDC002491]